MQEYIQPANKIYSDITAPLLEAIFFPPNPLHDDGVIIPPKEIDKKSYGIAEFCTCWESCLDCSRNLGLSFCPSGSLEIV